MVENPHGPVNLLKTSSIELVELHLQGRIWTINLPTISFETRYEVFVETTYKIIIIPLLS